MSFKWEGLRKFPKKQEKPRQFCSFVECNYDEKINLFLEIYMVTEESVKETYRV